MPCLLFSIGIFGQELKPLSIRNFNFCHNFFQNHLLQMARFTLVAFSDKINIMINKQKKNKHNDKCSMSIYDPFPYTDTSPDSSATEAFWKQCWKGQKLLINEQFLFLSQYFHIYTLTLLLFSIFLFKVVCCRFIKC